MNQIEVFLQGEGLQGTHSVTLREEAAVGELVEAAYRLGVVQGSELTLFLEEYEYEAEEKVEAFEHVIASDLLKLLKDLGIGHGSGVHLHHHRTIRVTVNYNAASPHREFRPGATVGKVLGWAVERFGIDPVEATEFGLFLCGQQSEAVDEGTHIGSLVEHNIREVCFDLGPKHRVQG